MVFIMNKIKVTLLVSILLVALFVSIAPLGAYPNLKWTFQDPQFTGPQPNHNILADVDGDGYLEIIVAQYPYPVYCINHDGSLRWKSSSTADPEQGGLKAADVDGDGFIEIIVHGADTPADGVFVCLDGRTGNQKWVSEAFGSDADSIPAIGDIDRDGITDIIVIYNYGDGLASIDGRNGTTKWKYNADRKLCYTNVGPVLADIDLDGKLEIIVPGENNKDEAYCFESDGSVKWHNTYTTSSSAFIRVTPTVGDFDRDGYPEIVVSNEAGVVYMIEHDGTIKWTNDQLTTLPVSFLVYARNIVSGDLNNNGQHEIVVSGSDFLAAFDRNGNLLWQKNSTMTGNDKVSIGMYTELALADINNDNRLEILYYNKDYLRIEARDYSGAYLWSYSSPDGKNFRDGGPSVADIDKNGRLEMIATSINNAVFCFDIGPDNTYMTNKWVTYSFDNYNSGFFTYVTNAPKSLPVDRIMKILEDNKE